MVLGKKNVGTLGASPRQEVHVKINGLGSAGPLTLGERTPNATQTTRPQENNRHHACWFYLVGLVHSESKFPQHSRPRPTIRRLLYGRPIYHCPKPAQPPKKTYRRPHDAHSLMLNLGSMGLYCRPQIPETQFACWTPPQSYGSAQRSISKHDKF